MERQAINGESDQLSSRYAALTEVFEALVLALKQEILS
jgi:hypothetical protein